MNTHVKGKVEHGGGAEDDGVVVRDDEDGSAENEELRQEGCGEVIGCVLVRGGVDLGHLVVPHGLRDV